jgi:hypothetical protein
VIYQGYVDAQNFNHRLAVHLKWSQVRERNDIQFDVGDKEIGSLKTGESGFRNAGGLFGRVGTIASSISSFCRSAESLLHNASLLAVNKNLPDQPTELKEGGEYQGRGESDAPIGRPPFARRLFLYALGLLGGFWLAFAGVQQLDGQRRIFGAALILIGVLGAVLGSGLFLATLAYPSTWGWWL